MKLSGLVDEKAAQASYRYYTRYSFIIFIFFLILCGSMRPVFATNEPNDPNRTEDKTISTNFIGTPIPDRIILQFVDSDGEPVEGAKIGTSIVIIRDTDMLNLKEGRFRWQLNGNVTSDNVSDKNGRIVILKEQLPQLSMPVAPGVSLYILHESRCIGAFVEITKDDLPGPKEVTLVPVCRVQGKVGSKGLDELGRPLGSVLIVFGPMGNLNCVSSSSERFTFLVPPGEYRLEMQCANTRDVRRKIKVEPEVTELDIGTIDLELDVLEDFLGKPAPEIGPIKEWEDGRPIRLADLKGKVVLLYFGGSYPDTMFAMSKLVELHKYYADKGLVIIALYTVESLKSIRDKLDFKYGGISGPAFKLAIDGGESRYINNQLMPGATHAKYKVGVWATNVLINKEGCVERLIDLRQAVEVIGQMLDTDLPQWLQNCKDTYRLEDDQVIKHITPPFLPQRREYFENLNPRLAKRQQSGPSGMLFRQEKEPALWGLVSHRSLNLSDVIEYVLDVSDPNYRPLGNSNSIEIMTELHNPDPEGFDRLLSTPVSGDWILRHETPLQEKIMALEKLIADEFGHKVRIERRAVERDTIIARGNFEFSPVYSNTEICIYSGPGEINRPTGEMLLGNADSLEEFLQRLGFMIGMPIINQTNFITDFDIRFRAHLGRPSLRHTKTLTKLKKQRLVFLLDSLSKQTNLNFEISRQPLDIWHIEDIKDD